jgi:hypothetical protein
VPGQKQLTFSMPLPSVEFWKSEEIQDLRISRLGHFFQIWDILLPSAQKCSVVELEPHGAETFGWSRSRNIEVSAPASGQLKYFEKI